MKSTQLQMDLNPKEIFVMPPTAEEMHAIEEHILYVTESKTKRTKRFREFLERYLKEWNRYIKTRSIPVRMENYFGWPSPLQEVMDITISVMGYDK